MLLEILAIGVHGGDSVLIRIGAGVINGFADELESDLFKSITGDDTLNLSDFLLQTSSSCEFTCNKYS